MCEWISVEDRLPDPHFYVIIWDDENAEMVIAAYQETGCWCSETIQEDAHVTHWMPLPEPPRE